MNRCPWVGENKPHYELYHDTEWGIPVHDDQKHFEMLLLEGAQAGLSWETILKRRPKTLLVELAVSELRGVALPRVAIFGSF